MRTAENTQGDQIRPLLRVPPKTKKHADCGVIEPPGTRSLVRFTVASIGSAA